ncbi:MAG: class A beta-lactamase-related serine hydrolase [Planctomycetota bacterium]|nr:MAG: class A beta-lactamase-related serine hydrolase [Planctomycetota bacterium]
MFQAVLLSLAPLVAQQSPWVPADVEILEKRCQSYWQEWLKDKEVPGVSFAFVLPDGRTGDVQIGKGLQPDSKLMSGSIGKTYFAAAVLKWVEEGKLSLDVPVATWLGKEPWFSRIPNAEKITLRHLLRHQSGLPEHVEHPDFWKGIRDDPDRVWKPQELLAFILDRPPLFEVEQGWSYADTNYILMGLAAETATGKNLYQEVQKRFLQPLGLRETLPADRRHLPALVQGHHRLRTQLTGLPGKTLNEEGLFVVNPQAEWAGGGFCSSTRDLARWGHHLWGRKVLSAATLGQMLEGVPANTAPGDRYGLGVQQWDSPHGQVLGHGGWFPGYVSELAHFQELKLTLAVQFNLDDVRRLGSPRRHLLELLGLLLRPAYTPSEGYEEEQVRGWKIHMHRGFAAENGHLADQTRDALNQQLFLVERALPPAASDALRQVPIWVEGPTSGVGMCFHPSQHWLQQNAYNPEKAGSVELSNPKHFLDWLGHQPYMVLHEMAHAFHFRVLDRQFPEQAKALNAAFQNAQASGLYQSILIWNGKTGKSYALTNVREYFAELSEAFFGTNDFYPFVKAELQQYDPLGFQAVADAWQVLESNPNG